MAEKRKQPPRAGREPAAKKRVSEAATPAKKKEKAPTPKPPTPPPEPVEAPLPTIIREGDPLPVRKARQPIDLSDEDYQSIAESAVLLISLERSKKKWLSDGILVRYYTKPKKTKRELIEKNNPPKESMTKVGLCDITVGPHLFDAMIYTVKDPSVPQQFNYAPQQRQMIHYGPPGNFQQYQPYQQSPGQQKRPPYTPTPGTRPPQGYPGSQSPAPRGPQPGGHGPSSQQSHRPSQTPNGQSGQPAKPSPDPVIQMLATRAAADPELKALMRVVASSQASQEQLRAFQAHIDELNAIIKAREQQEKRQQAAAAAAAHQQQASQAPPATPAAQTKPPAQQGSAQPKQESSAKPTPQVQESKQSEPLASTPSKAPEPPHPASSTPAAPPAKPENATTPRTASSVPASNSGASQQSGTGSTQKQASEPAVKQESVTQDSGKPSTATPNATNSTPTVTPATTQALQTTPGTRPAPISTPQQPNHRPIPSYTPQQQTPYGSQPPLQSRPQPYATSSLYQPKPPPPRLMYKAVVFEFTSPLTPYGSSTSGHAGSGDRYLFPEHSILEWLPSDNTLLASFIITRKVDPNTPFPIEPAPEPTTVRGKGKGASKSKKGDKKGKDEDKKDTPETPLPGQSTVSTPSTNPPTAPANASKPETKQEAPETPSEAPKKEDLKEYWQPVTFRIHAADSRILEPLTRVVKPADEVRKYMNDIMDRAERAPDGFLALRLPHEEALEALEAESMAAPTLAASARNRSSRASAVKLEEESEVETPVLDVEEEEEDLKDFYGDPMGLPPLRV